MPPPIKKPVLCFVRSTEEWFRYEAAWNDMVSRLYEEVPGKRIIGIDAEWFGKNPLAVFQASSAEYCFVLHLSWMRNRELPTRVKETLEDPNIIKCGVGINGDVKRLQAEQRGLTMQTVLDIGNYAIYFNLSTPGQTNLAALVGTLSGFCIEKDKYITRSNWELPLNNRQVIYAADDAFASFLCGDVIMNEAVKRFGDRTRDPCLFLEETANEATSSFKCRLREYSKQNSKNIVIADGQTNKEKTPVSQVRVIDKDGNFLFYCSFNRAKFYVGEKGLAIVTRPHHRHADKPGEIKFCFDPKVKTRLCTYYKIGLCDMENCPFAHGMEELALESRELLGSSQPSCACCLATKNLKRHSIVPPSLRMYFPESQQGYVASEHMPVCGQCFPVLGSLYDQEIWNMYTEASDATGEVFSIKTLRLCFRYAKLLLDKDKLKEMPPDRVEFLKSFIAGNWEPLHLGEFMPIAVTSADDVSPEVLRGVLSLSEDTVRNKFIVSTLIGDDEEKAQNMIDRFKHYCLEKCGLMEKDSNELSPEEWAQCCPDGS